MKMANYRIIVLPTEECNPEYAPEKDLQEGFEADGFLIMTQRDEEPESDALMNLNVDMIKKWLRNRKKVGNIVRAAAGMADAEIKAVELLKENEMKEFIRNMKEAFNGD
jgi:hypothetical protein